MRPLTLDEIADRDTYESLRADYRARVIALKRRRRVPVGDRVTLVFENRETLRFQVQEMCRVERIDDPAAVQHELDVYNELMPREGELSATLFIEIPELAQIRPELERLVGIDEHVSLAVGDAAIRASFDPKQMEEDRISAVQYLRFALPPDARQRLADPAIPARLRIDHPRYRHQAELPAEVRESLLLDLRGEAEPLFPAERLAGGLARAGELLEAGPPVRVVRAGAAHVVVEPSEPLPAGALLGADDPALALALLRAVERHARALRGEGGAVRVRIELGGDRPRWHVQLDR